VFAAITSTKEDDPNSARTILDADPTALEAVDDTGMTPLMHASWKSKLKTLKMLLDMGADVNGGQHEHNYSALHFASLAGSVDACGMLLEAGANPDAINTVKRTAAQMAAFVGKQYILNYARHF